MGERLKAGDRLFTGAKVTDQGAAAYNSASETIEQFEREGRDPPEYLLNGRHNLLCALAYVESV